jgi:hypothetical protein
MAATAQRAISPSDPILRGSPDFAVCCPPVAYVRDQSFGRHEIVTLVPRMRIYAKSHLDESLRASPEPSVVYTSSLLSIIDLLPHLRICNAVFSSPVTGALQYQPRHVLRWYISKVLNIVNSLLNDVWLAPSEHLVSPR